jgi:hypothetical protein
MFTLVDLLFICSRWMLEPILGLLGYDWNWEPIRDDTRRKHVVVQAAVCFFTVVLLTVGLIWLAWFLSG